MIKLFEAGIFKQKLQCSIIILTLPNFTYRRKVKPTMDQITQEDLTGIGELLGLILQNDNEIRKDAEAKLNQAKLAATDKYALILATVIHPNSAQFSLEAKSLAAVILRRNISITDIAASDITN